jgi:prepilin-type N-terminal cleavage/methylation domain-containing protein/prepilin-type processing-associated H-X9-DG protein
MNALPKPSCRHEPGRRRAFTLTELLVVIAIIAILAAILVPTLGRATEQGRKISCINRFRQWNIALVMYKDENEDSIPRESYIPDDTVLNPWTQVQNALGGDVWYNQLPPQLGQRKASSYAPSALRGEFYDRNLLFHCPKAFFSKDSAKVHNGMAYFSIAMNSRLILVSQSTMKFTSIQLPASTVTFLDGRLPGERKVDPASPSENEGQPSAYATRFVTRHLGRGTLAFADGHVECLPGSDVVANGYAIVPQRRIVWTADPSLDPNTLLPTVPPTGP